MNRVKLGQLKELKINVGCGRTVSDGYLGIDILDYGQEIVWDIERGIPLPDSSCSNIFCSHTIEHLTDVVGVMNEFWRVLEEGGELFIVCPHKSSENAYLVQHENRFDEQTFRGFDYSEREDRDWEKDYNIKPWRDIDTVVNSRKDIHVKMRPRK